MTRLCACSASGTRDASRRGRNASCDRRLRTRGGMGVSLRVAYC